MYNSTTTMQSKSSLKRYGGLKTLNKKVKVKECKKGNEKRALGILADVAVGPKYLILILNVLKTKP